MTSGRRKSSVWSLYLGGSSQVILQFGSEFCSRAISAGETFVVFTFKYRSALQSLRGERSETGRPSTRIVVNGKPASGGRSSGFRSIVPRLRMVNGEIQVVPHDHGPRCWEQWDFKFENRTCPHCGTTLGQDCKVLLDSDVCPHCDEGSVSMTKPVCDKCGYKVDMNLVAWG
jgi:hypothetical protein